MVALNLPDFGCSVSRELHDGNFGSRLIVEHLKCHAMVLESWESVQANQNVPTFCARHFIECFQIACTKSFTVELMVVSGLWDMLKVHTLSSYATQEMNINNRIL